MVICRILCFVSVFFSVMMTHGCGYPVLDKANKTDKNNAGWFDSVDDQDPIFSWKKLCLATNGQWSNGLLSCVCPEQSLFDVASGCFQVKKLIEMEGCHTQMMSIPQDMKKCMSNLLRFPSDEFWFDIDSFDASEIQSIAQQALDDWSVFYRGISISRSRNYYNNFFIAQKDINSIAAWQTWFRLGGCPTAGNLIPFDPIKSFVRDNASLKDEIDGCISTLMHTSLDKLQAEKMCTALHILIGAIRGQDYGFVPEKFMTEFIKDGLGCSQDSPALLTNVRINGFNLRYQINFAADIPVVRMVDIMGPNQFWFRAVVSAIGQVENYNSFFYEFADRKSNNLLIHHEIMCDSDGQLLSREAILLGDRAGLEAVELDLQNNRDVGLPLDGQRISVIEPINGALMETGVDPRIPGLAARLGINFSGNLPQFACSHNDTIYGLRNILGDDHGTKMAAIIAADLMGLKLHLIGTNSMRYYESRYEIMKNWIDIIESTNSRIVNISRNFTMWDLECDVFFSELFNRFPEVLFVVGAGNDSSHNSVSSCPASLAIRFPNVLTVAGVDATGQLHQDSSHGKDLAKIAAPFRSYTIETVPSSLPLSQETRLTTISGTSVSAALVSNAALRYLARHPNTTALELADIFMNACLGQNLDVACGGQLNFDKLEQL